MPDSVIRFPLGRSATADPMVRFMEKVIPEPMSGCWLWIGQLSRTGYARFKIGRRYVAAHRWLYERTVGFIPDGLESDHKCRVRSCVNPDHIRAITHRENSMIADQWLRRKNHCKNGHPYDKAVDYDHPRRVCLRCGRESMRRSRVRRRRA